MPLQSRQKKALAAKLGRDPNLYCCYPQPHFPTLSITGDHCAQQCKHCSRHYLRSMTPCVTPDDLVKRCSELASGGVRGLLLSGGYNSEGYVPFVPFLDAIVKVKRDTGLFISAHTGLVPNGLARELGRVGVDLADFDLIGDDETIRLVIGTDWVVADYRRALLALDKSLPHVVPHVCVGLHAGKLRGEIRALDMAAEVAPQVLVLLALIPTPGTAFAGVEPPSPADLAKIVAEARLKLPDSHIALGCMRPRGQRRAQMELAALRSGVDRMVMPMKGTIDEARNLGLAIRRLNACCSVPISWGVAHGD